MVELKYPPPKEFLEPETRDGYFISKEMKEVWAVELDLVQEVLRICHKYNLKIFADWGSLIGAIRHKGFIPWDDDFDFSMLRADYEKFCKVADNEIKEPYCIQIADNAKEIFCGHIKIRNSKTTAILNSEAKRKLEINQGIFLDIFPLDNVCDNVIIRFFQKKVALILQYISWTMAFFSCRYFESSNIILKYPKKAIHKIFGNFFRKILSKTYKNMIKTCMWFSKKTTATVAPLTFHTNVKARNRSIFDEIQFVPFEFLEIPVVKKYDEALTALYGNWRIPKMAPSYHGAVFFDVNKTYKEYIKG